MTGTGRLRSAFCVLGVCLLCACRADQLRSAAGPAPDASDDRLEGTAPHALRFEREHGPLYLSDPPRWTR